jgi:hypothetical protein
LLLSGWLQRLLPNLQFSGQGKGNCLMNDVDVLVLVHISVFSASSMNGFPRAAAEFMIFESSDPTVPNFGKCGFEFPKF